MAKKRHTTALARQSLVDIALMDGGDVEAMYDLAVRNGIGNLPHLLQPGRELVSEAPQLDTDVVRYFAERVWKPITGKIVPAPLVCTGAQVTVALPEGGTLRTYSSSASWITLARPEDEPLMFSTGGTNIVDVALEPGNYCLWASDPTGEPSGTLEAWLIDDGNTLIAGGNIARWFYFEPFTYAGSVVDLRQSEGGATAVWLVAPNCHSVLIPEGLQFFDFILTGAKLDQQSVDAICNALSEVVSFGNACIIDGGTSASPTAASADNRALYIANGGTIVTN